jgi:peptidoglycan/LPS O-acetylase OafA/YrhL
MPHRPQLDSLRAFAILIVMVHHYMTHPFVLAGYGVILFFVLSGYFATRGLLKSRDRLAEGSTHFSEAMRLFYSRRYLRIMPIYFLVLLVTAVFDVEYARNTFLANATFTSNFAMLADGEWYGRFSHFWSLAVLEQFYLVWPLAVLLCPRKWLLSFTIGLVALGPLYRGYCQWMDYQDMYWTLMPLGSIDWLAAGALLAVCQTEGLEARVAKVGAWCGPLLVGLILCRRLGWQAPGYAIYVPALASVFFIWLTARCRLGFNGRLGWLLDQPWLARIGQMSYSIFLLHCFSGLLLPHFAWLQPILDSDARMVVLIPATIGLAWLSWKFVEQPILRLKERLTAGMLARVQQPCADASN